MMQLPVLPRREDDGFTIYPLLPSSSSGASEEDEDSGGHAKLEENGSSGDWIGSANLIGSTWWRQLHRVPAAPSFSSGGSEPPEGKEGEGQAHCKATTATCFFPTRKKLLGPAPSSHFFTLLCTLLLAPPPGRRRKAKKGCLELDRVASSENRKRLLASPLAILASPLWTPSRDVPGWNLQQPAPTCLPLTTLLIWGKGVALLPKFCSSPKSSFSEV